MSNQDYTTTITVDQSPKEAFDAINNVRGWWSGNILGDTHKLGDVFTYRYEDVHFSKQKITEFVPNQRVVWTVLDASLSFVKDKGEWKGTKVIFEVSKKGDKTQVRFIHQGLVPQVECYDACTDAWGSYIRGSLRQLITTAKGFPNQKEQDTRKLLTIEALNTPSFSSSRLDRVSDSTVNLVRMFRPA